MEVIINKGLDHPIEIVYGDRSVCISLDEAEDLKASLDDAISEFYMDEENDVIRNMAKYLHKNGVRASKTLEMAGELQQINLKYCKKINLEEYYQDRRKREQEKEAIKPENLK